MADVSAAPSPGRPAPPTVALPEPARPTEGAIGSERPAGTERPARAEWPTGAEGAAGAPVLTVAVRPPVAMATGAAARVAAPAVAGESASIAVSGRAEALRVEHDVVASHRTSPLVFWVP